MASDVPTELIAGRYRLSEQIAKGGHSVVYRARDDFDGEDVAVKVLADRFAGEPEYAVRMVRERRALALLDGTAVVRVFGVHSMQSGALCLVMELLVGRDLDDLVVQRERAERRFAPSELTAMLDPIAQTLHVAHDAGVIHRDLKPGNIFVLDRGGVRLLDFGLAKLLDATPVTRDGFVIGSPSYIAPEVWEGKPALIDARADVYSLGAILFRLLAGRVPFPADRIRDRIRLATTAPRPSLHALRPDLPREVDDWVQQALAVRRDDRFQTVRAMWNAFRDVVAVSRVNTRGHTVAI